MSFEFPQIYQNFVNEIQYVSRHSCSCMLRLTYCLSKKAPFHVYLSMHLCFLKLRKQQCLSISFQIFFFLKELILTFLFLLFLGKTSHQVMSSGQLITIKKKIRKIFGTPPLESLQAQAEQSLTRAQLELVMDQEADRMTQSSFPVYFSVSIAALICPFY